MKDSVESQKSATRARARAREGEAGSMEETLESASLLRRQARHRLLEFLINAALQLGVPPIVKYTALSLFADRFLPSLVSSLSQGNKMQNWLLQPIRESNLQLFALISIWISSKLHDTCPLSSKSLKALGDKNIMEQHFTTRDFVEAELVFMEVLGFEIGASNVVFTFLEELLIQFRELSRIGELVSFNACMDIMDLLYETDETSMLYSHPHSLAASILLLMSSQFPSNSGIFHFFPGLSLLPRTKKTLSGNL